MIAHTDRERRIVETFALLADTLVAGFDVLDLLQTLVDACGSLLDTDAAGLLLADETGRLELAASTSEASRLVEVMQLSAYAGPCIETFRTGKVLSVPDIAQVSDEWRDFRIGALRHGFHAVVALPLRLRETRIGTLNLLNERVGDLGDDDIVVAQAFADVATIGILQDRALRESDVVRRQLQNALNSRVIIEQAKGVVAHTRKVSVEDAFTIIRDYARSHSLKLVDVASMLVNRSLVL
jgi:GAF domain-containing protein